jgi:hypothetical protein
MEYSSWAVLTSVRRSTFVRPKNAAIFQISSRFRWLSHRLIFSRWRAPS